MNLIAAHLSSMKTRMVMAIMILGVLLNSCEKEKLVVPTNIGTIRFAANTYTIENNTVAPLSIVLPLSLPLEQDAVAVITIDDQSTISADEYTISPAIPATGLTLNLAKGATEISFQLSSLNNFEGDKTLVLKLTAASGGLTVANTTSTASVTIKGNPIVIPEIKTSETGVAFGSVLTSSTSASKAYVLTAVKLTEDVIINASANFEVSLDDATFGNTATIPVATANFSPVTVYVRFIANTGLNQTITGTITHSSGDVQDAIVNVSGVEFGVAMPGVLVMSEDFNYGSTASTLKAVAAANWPVYSGTVNPVKYVVPGLTFTGYAGSAIGGAVVSENGSGSREDYTRTFNDQKSGSVYVAQLLNIASAPTAATFFSSFGDGTTGTPAYFNRVYIKASGSKYSLGISRNSTAATYAATDLDFGTTYLVVHKYEFGTGISSMYVLTGSVPTIEPATPSALSNQTGADPSAITRYVIRQDTGNPLTVTFDGIRVATSWKEAVGL
jgi:hypothetical protein